MAITAFVVRVPSIDGVVADLRNRFDSTAVPGVPAHISVLVPFMDPGKVTAGVLAAAQQALCEVPSFEFKLGQVGRFPATAYLAPEPAAPFIAMTQALVRRFPAFPAYAGEFCDVVPHLTVAHGDSQQAAAAAGELKERMRSTGPIAARCTSVVLLENASGRWRPMHEFALPVSA